MPAKFPAAEPYVDDAAAYKRPALELAPKVTAATLGGSLATITIVILEHSGVTVTAELGAAVATVCAAALGWLAR